MVFEIRTVNKKLLGAFLLGFTIWFPFLLLAYAILPFHLTVDLERLIWGWEMGEIIYEHGMPLLPVGSYISLFSLAVFYGMYAGLVFSICYIGKETEEKSVKGGDKV